MIAIIVIGILIVGLVFALLISSDDRCPMCGGEMNEVKGWPEKEQCADCKFTQRRW